MTPLQQLAYSIINYAHNEVNRWSYQGFGMLRYYLAPDWRLHIWDPDRAVDGVSTVHTHPWSATSHVLSQGMADIQYRWVSDPGGDTARQRILCGEGGGLKGDSEFGRLVRFSGSVMTLSPGATYSFSADTIHRSVPDRGAVTLLQRIFSDDSDHADVFFNRRAGWGSAEPRPATPEEVEHFQALALDFEGWE